MFKMQSMVLKYTFKMWIAEVNPRSYNWTLTKQSEVGQEFRKFANQNGAPWRKYALVFLGLGRAAW